MHRKAQRHFPAYAAVFATVQQMARAKVGDTGVLMSHFPYSGTPDRFSREEFEQWQLRNFGQWLVHGHTHSAERRSGIRSLCVSLEAWDLRPASADDLVAVMSR